MSGPGILESKWKYRRRATMYAVRTIKKATPYGDKYSEWVMGAILADGRSR